jgi:superfamily II DNA or RNA helicase
MLRVFLPPNLVDAASRDAIAVRIDLEWPTPPAMPPAQELGALALLQQWMGPGAQPAPRLFLQFKREQLRALIGATAGLPLYSWANRAAEIIRWTGKNLDGVSEALAAAAGPATEPGKKGVPAAAQPRPPSRPEFAGPSGMTVDGTEHYLAITLPQREHHSYASALELVKQHGFLAEPSNGKWWLRDRHKTLTFLAEYGDKLRGHFRASFTPDFVQRTAHLQPVEIVANAAEAGGGEFEVTVGLRAGPAPEAELRSALMGGRNYVEAGGRIALIGSGQLAQLVRAQRALSGDPAAPAAARQTRRVTGAQTSVANDILEELSPGFEAPETWKRRSGALKNLSALQAAPMPAALAAQLRPYQKIGVAWLWHLDQNQLGGILADEMGLGKTLQALGLILCLPGPALVVCPASLLENWRREAARFASGLRVFVHHGARRLASAAACGDYDLIITSYGTLVRDEDLFRSAKLRCVIADEAQHLKNRRSQNARALRGLNARGRFLLTGTPLENSLDDLRSLFEFILPGYLSSPPPGTRGSDKAWHDDRLRAQAAPYILRRTKAAVAPELPPKLEQVLWCELTDHQTALYRRTQESGERALIDLEAGGASDAQVRFAALTQLLRLRQICCDPRLVESADGDLQARSGPAADPKALKASAPVGTEYAFSGKLDALRELVAQAWDDGHRILLFSQFTSLLALLRAEFDAQETPYCYLDGSMSATARQAQVDRFQASSEIPLFLLSLKAGGTGLNLTGADTVIHFDPWWNPAAELQATDRAHRIGQTQTVTSYKLIASGTVEEKVLGLQAEKRALLQNVFEASDAAAAKLTIADLKGLLAVSG